MKTTSDARSRISIERRGGHAVAALVLGALLGACSPVLFDFQYTPNEIEGAPETGLKIAVLPFVDGRETFEEGSHAWRWLPGVLYATESYDERQPPEAAAGADYHFPTLVAYTLAVDLTQNRIGSRVDLAPKALEDYDLVIHGKLEALARHHRLLTYGLGPLRFFSQWVALPQEQKWVELEASYVAYDSSGELLLEAPVRQEWRTTQWSSQWPEIHGVVHSIRDANRTFVEDLVRTLPDEYLASPKEVVRERIRSFHAHLDPELEELVTERDRVRKKDGRLYQRYADAIDREVKRRAKLLETYRRVEERIIAMQQAYVYETQHQRLLQINEYRQAQRTAAFKAEQLKRKHRQAAIRPLAGALVAGITPALTDANAYGKWTPEHWQMLSQDLGAALEAVPTPPPPPDLEPLLREMKVDMHGLESAGAVLRDVKGNDIPGLRTSFLGKYEERTRSLERLKRDFVRTVRSR